MWRVDGTGLRTTLVQNCGMVAIKRTIFLHNALAGQRFPDLSITINSLALWNTSCSFVSLIVVHKLKEGVWKT